MSEAEDTRVESLLEEARQRWDRIAQEMYERERQIKEIIRAQDESLRKILAEIEYRSDAIARLTPKAKGLVVPKKQRDESRADLDRRLNQVPTQPKRIIQGTQCEPGDYGLS